MSLVAGVKTKEKEKVIGMYLAGCSMRTLTRLLRLVDDGSKDESRLFVDSSKSSSESSGSDSDDTITSELLESLLDKARKKYAAAAAKEAEASSHVNGLETFITLADGLQEGELPPLDPGAISKTYFEFGKSRSKGAPSIRDPDVEKIKKAALSIPEPPRRPSELTKSGKPLTKKEKKKLEKRTAGPDWFDLPAPDEADLPRLYREVEALRLRNQLDPKRFYKKDEGEGKGIKGLPKYFAVGTILPSSTPFGTASSENLSRANRKRTLVDELVDDAEAKRYTKKKFDELQVVHEARGRNTLHVKRAQRRPKW